MSNQDLIIVKQLPIIQEQLKQLSEDIDKKVDEALKMECTEENKQLVKTKRADLKKDFNELEERRKNVKEQVLKPYNEFETIYKQYVTEKFNKADTDLKNKIDSIENEQKKRLEDEARRYFTEYVESKKIDFIKFEKMDLKIGLSDNPTKLKKQITAFIDQKVDDLNLIETQEHKEEILVEYKQTLNVSQAITTVSNRFKAIEEEKKKQELKANLIKQMSDEADRAKNKVVHIEMNENHEISNKSYKELENIFDKPLEQPKEEKQEEILRLKFIVKGTRTKLEALKEFLKNGGYDYE